MNKNYTCVRVRVLIDNIQPNYFASIWMVKSSQKVPFVILTTFKNNVTLLQNNMLSLLSFLMANLGFKFQSVSIVNLVVLFIYRHVLYTGTWLVTICTSTFR